MFRIRLPIAMISLAALTLGAAGVGALSQASDGRIGADEADMAWRLMREGDEARLSYGVARSDVLAIMLTCAPGREEAIAYGVVQPDSPRLIVTHAGPAELDPLSGGLAYEARVPLSDATLRGLAREGGLRVRGDGGAHVLPASRAERRLVSEFLAYCGTGRV